MIRVGTAGWSYADWEGRVYPREKPPGFHPLAWLARSFHVVEINSSFYALPQARHAERWTRLVETDPDFRFTVKLQKRFTHEPWNGEGEGVEDTAERFLAGIEPLRRAGKLGALLAQFPHSFRRTPETRSRLAGIRDLFGDLPIVLELRHASWFAPEALARIADSGCSLAHIDLPRGPEQAPADFAPVGPLAYLRLHGRNREAWFDPRAGRDQRYDYLYDEQEVQELVKRVRSLAGERDETYVVTNNHFSGKAVANAIEILAGLEDESPLAPPPLLEAFPRLRKVARLAGQQELY